MCYVLLILVLISISTCRLKSFNFDYITKESTLTIKGFFVVLVLLSHTRGAYPHEIDYLSNFVLKNIGQLMVTMFFFYSGFGIFESFKTKPNYGVTFFKHRILKTLIHFDVALVFYILIGLLFKHHYPLRNYITCWIGWDSIGNSNWFIFATLVLYGGVYFYYIYTLIKKTNDLKPLIIIVTIISLLYIVGMRVLGRGGFWYDTILCFSVGMIYSMYKSKIELAVFQKGYFLSLFYILILFLLTYFHNRGWSYIICTCLFCLLVVMITMKIWNQNPYLEWLGKYLFEIYILQRIPMLILNQVDSHYKLLPLVYTTIVILLTLLLSMLYARIVSRVDSVLFKEG